MGWWQSAEWAMRAVPWVHWTTPWQGALKKRLHRLGQVARHRSAAGNSEAVPSAQQQRRGTDQAGRGAETGVTSQAVRGGFVRVCERGKGGR